MEFAKAFYVRYVEYDYKKYILVSQNDYQNRTDDQ